MTSIGDSLRIGILLVSLRRKVRDDRCVANLTLAVAGSGHLPFAAD
jgi:hypothetical protein